MIFVLNTVELQVHCARRCKDWEINYPKIAKIRVLKFLNVQIQDNISRFSQDLLDMGDLSPHMGGQVQGEIDIIGGN